MILSAPALAKMLRAMMPSQSTKAGEGAIRDMLWKHRHVLLRSLEQGPGA